MLFLNVNIIVIEHSQYKSLKELLKEPYYSNSTVKALKCYLPIAGTRYDCWQAFGVFGDAADAIFVSI